MSARIVVLSEPRRDPVARMDLGLVRTGRRMTAPWPEGAALPAGRYLARVHALDPNGRTLLRRPRKSGLLVFTVQPAQAAPARRRRRCSARSAQESSLWRART